MAKVNYERLNKVKYTTLEEAEVGDIIEFDNYLYVVTDCYSYSDEACRGIMNILGLSFGELEYIDRTVSVKILEDAEITIKY
jgi:hypothetical protein